jgi:hypothetical protein
MAEWAPDEAPRTKILVDNACALYGFPAPEKGSDLKSSHPHR